MQSPYYQLLLEDHQQHCRAVKKCNTLVSLLSQTGPIPCFDLELVLRQLLGFITIQFLHQLYEMLWYTKLLQHFPYKGIMKDRIRRLRVVNEDMEEEP